MGFDVVLVICRNDHSISPLFFFSSLFHLLQSRCNKFGFFKIVSLILLRLIMF